MTSQRSDNRSVADNVSLRWASVAGNLLLCCPDNTTFKCSGLVIFNPDRSNATGYPDGILRNYCQMYYFISKKGKRP